MVEPAGFFPTKKSMDQSIDLVVTSPPYNVDIQYNSHDDTGSYADYIDFCRRRLRHGGSYNPVSEDSIRIKTGSTAEEYIVNASDRTKAVQKVFRQFVGVNLYRYSLSSPSNHIHAGSIRMLNPSYRIVSSWLLVRMTPSSR